jgi:hypothetical protein
VVSEGRDLPSLPLNVMAEGVLRLVARAMQL